MECPKEVVLYHPKLDMAKVESAVIELGGADILVAFEKWKH